jgi:hypothetical protein
MADKVQARVDQLKSILFHFSLVKLLVVEELKKLNRVWDSFLASSNILLDPKRDTPLYVERLASNSSGEKEEVLWKGENEKRLRIFNAPANSEES